MKKNNGTMAVVLAMVIMLTAVLVNSIWFADSASYVPKLLKTILKNDAIYKSDDSFADVCEAHSLTDAQYAGGAMTSGVVMECSSRRALIDNNMHAKCYPASTTKVLTALVVLQRLPLEMTVTVPKRAVGVEGSSIYLRAGQRVTVEDLLYGLMLRSGNDAAQTLAYAVAGSIDAFARIMNEVARQCGAQNSNFVNPHGLHDDMHYTTAYDMALIASKAYEYEEFRKIVNTKIAKISIDGESVAIGNKNKLLKQYKGANGVKTGYTKKSGRCLVGGAEREDMQLISVVMNCPDMWRQTANMLDVCFENYRMTPLDEALAMDGQNVIELSKEDVIGRDWKEIFYPLRKDGSECVRLV